MIALQPLAGV